MKHSGRATGWVKAFRISGGLKKMVAVVLPEFRSKRFSSGCCVQGTTAN